MLGAFIAAIHSNLPPAAQVRHSGVAAIFYSFVFISAGQFVALHQHVGQTLLITALLGRSVVLGLTSQYVVLWTSVESR